MVGLGPGGLDSWDPLGFAGNQQKTQESLPADNVNRKSAQKIAQLPVAQTFKAELAHFLITSSAAWGQDLTAKAEFTEHVDQHWRNSSNWRSLGRITTAWKRPVTNAKAAAHTTQTND